MKSPHHQVKIDSPNATSRVIRLAEGQVPADRDFELTWKPAAEKAPSVGLFHEHVGDADYLLAFVTPPAVEQAERKPLPREVIFVIDNSGSMGGTSITQAKASLIFGLSRLQPSDRFNVIRFDHTMDVLFTDSVPADAAHIGQATSFVNALQASGGTEMVPAMHAALTDNAHDDTNTLRQVVFLTDGEIGNEQQLFETITAMRGRSRVFMVGIGSAPNTYLMTRAAELGRGAYTHIGSVDQVEERMRGLFAKLENPAVTGLAVKFSGASADMAPAVLPDLYRDEPLVLAAKLDKLQARSRSRDISATGRGRDLAAGECRRRQGPLKAMGAPQDQRCRGGAHHAAGHSRRSRQGHSGAGAAAPMVTRLTSLVAVDKTPSRPEGMPLKLTDLPLNLPAGWDFAKVFGERPQMPKPPAERRADAGDVQTAMRSARSLR